jgi:hypothetical protein
LKKTANSTETIELKTVTGNFFIFSGIMFDATGNPVYQCQAEPTFADFPTVMIYENDTASEEQILSLQNGIYSTLLSNTDFSEGMVFFSAPDSTGENFFVPQNASVIDVSDLGYMRYLSNMQIKLYLERTETTAEKIALLSSDFPAPQTGLPDSVCRVSDIYCLNAYPAGSELKTGFQIHYNADSLEAVVPESMTLYKWENAWIPMETGVDLVHQTVSATIDGPGYFAAFLDLTQSRMATYNAGNLSMRNPAGWQLDSNYPNPFFSSTTIRFELPVNSKVTLEIYDIHGRRVCTLINKSMSAGGFSATWDGIDETGNMVPSGIYFCVLNTEHARENRKMVLMR